MLIIHLSVSSFIALANVRHQQLTTERLTAASRLIHIHSQIKSALYCCFQLLALCSPSASADFQAVLFWNIPGCWTWAALEHVGIGSLSGLLLGNVHCDWQRWSPGWRMDGKCFFFFSQPPERLHFSVHDSARWEIPIVSEKVEEVD